MNIQNKAFLNINLADPFFDTLKQDYAEFEAWFKKKQGDNSKALIMESEAGVEAFLYLKKEDGTIDDVDPPLPAQNRLKVGTFKVNPHGTRLGERFIKKIFDYGFRGSFKEAYVTIFPKHTYLLQLLKRYGFEEVGTKSTSNGEELVLLKSFLTYNGDLLKDYPLLNLDGVNKYLLSIYPAYHTRLFPDSILNNENFDIIQDVSHTNSIHKVYICFMNVSSLQRNDLIIIYRTSDMPGKAHYRSVVTSVCTVEEIRKGTSFASVEEFLVYCQAYSVFSEDELREWFKKANVFVIKMMYNAAFSRRVNRKVLLEEIKLNPDSYWGFMKLTNDEFARILTRGEINESLIINQAGVR